MNSDELADALLEGDYAALARAITVVENREAGYRDLIAKLHRHAGDARVLGITGSPGAGKSTLVDKVAAEYRNRGLSVGVIAIDPSSPYTGGAVLGDRIRMTSNVGDMDVFFRSMSARGSLGGVSNATADAVVALDAFGMDVIIIETVGAGQNEIDIVRTADLVSVLVPPSSGDDVQMLKAGILEIADVFVVNKADLDGADRTVNDLTVMVHADSNVSRPEWEDHHEGSPELGADPPPQEDDERPPIVKTVATEGEGIDELLTEMAARYDHLEETGQLEAQARRRHAESIRRLVREDISEHVEEEIASQGGIAELVDQIRSNEADPYTLATELVESITAPETPIEQ